MIVITGGAGFIGSNLLAGLEARGRHDLVVADRLGQDDKWRNIARRELLALIDPSALRGFLDEAGRSVEAVFHLGAVSATTERDVDLIVETNLRLSLTLWHWCAGHRVRFIYASSAATYGDGSQGFSDDGSSAALARLRPLNPYGWSKHLFDRRVARMTEDPHAIRPPQWAGLKFFNVYGPNEYHKGDMRSVAHKMYGDVAAGRPARLFRSTAPGLADGGQSRDFVHVDDCVAVMLWLLDNPGVNGLFNVGTGTARSFNDLAAAVFGAAGRPAVIDYIDMPDTLKARYQSHTRAETGRLRAAGYAVPFRSLEDGVGQYCRDFLAADDPYR